MCRSTFRHALFKTSSLRAPTEESETTSSCPFSVSIIGQLGSRRECARDDLLEGVVFWFGCVRASADDAMMPVRHIMHIVAAGLFRHRTPAVHHGMSLALHISFREHKSWGNVRREISALGGSRAMYIHHYCPSNIHSLPRAFPKQSNRCPVCRTQCQPQIGPHNLVHIRILDPLKVLQQPHNHIRSRYEGHLFFKLLAHDVSGAWETHVQCRFGVRR